MGTIFKNNNDSRDEVENDEDMVMEFNMSNVELSSDSSADDANDRLEIKKIFVDYATNED